MEKSTDLPAVIPTATTDQDALVYYCAWDGRVRPVKARELDQVEHGGVRIRYCKRCEAMTPHAVITRAESEDDASLVEVLVRVLNFRGVLVRRSPRDGGFYGVQVNRYDGTDRFDDPGRGIPTGTEVMLCGPVAASELVEPLQDACRVADAPDDEFIKYNVGPRGLSFMARQGRYNGGGMIRLNLYLLYGQPAEVAEPAYPPFRLFATKLRQLLSTDERTALALILTGKENELNMQQTAVLERPAGINVSSWHYDNPDQAVRVSRNEAPEVIW